MKNYQTDLFQDLKAIEKYSKQNVKNWFNDFPSIATDYLLKLDSTPLQDPKVLAQFFSMHDWPTQHFTSGHFADLSFTLFRNDHFILDLYIWHHQDTNIHDHHFSGAFKVIQGESLHIEYDFQKSKIIAPWLEEGKLNVREKSQLVSGDVKTILFKNDFIHQNMHTANPSVTLCLRTIDHPEIRLNSYYNLGMKMEMNTIAQANQKILEGLMHLCTFPNNEELGQQLISNIPDVALYNTISGFNPIFNRAPPAFHSAIHEVLKSRDENLFNWVSKVIKHQSRLNLKLATLFKSPS